MAAFIPDFTAFGDLDLAWVCSFRDKTSNMGDFRPNLNSMGKLVTIAHAYGNITLVIASIEIANGGRMVAIRFASGGVFMCDGVRSTIDSVWVDLSNRDELCYMLEGDKDIGDDRHFRIPVTLWKVE